jgi:hypothetical protein
MIAVFHSIDASNCSVERCKIARSPHHHDKMAAEPLPAGRLKMKSLLASCEDPACGMARQAAGE